MEPNSTFSVTTKNVPSCIIPLVPFSLPLKYRAHKENDQIQKISCETLVRFLCFIYQINAHSRPVWQVYSDLMGTFCTHRNQLWEAKRRGLLTFGTRKTRTKIQGPNSILWGGKTKILLLWLLFWLTLISWPDRQKWGLFQWCLNQERFVTQI